MQIFRFIFLARSWASDRLYLSAQLSKLGRKAQQQDNPFALIIYPEGTLVSSDTRPVSKKYAEKMGIVSATLAPYIWKLTHRGRPTCDMYFYHGLLACIIHFAHYRHAFLVCN